MRKTQAAFLLAIAVVAAVWLQARQAAPADPSYWESDVRNFERQDQKSPPPKGAIVFTGSSSIAFWDIRGSFPDLQTINRGFGGSEMSDAAYYASRLVVPYAPRIVVLYSGDNDIGRGVAPESVEAGFERFAQVVHAALPKTRIIVIGVKPSFARWSVYPQMRKTNALMRAYAESHKELNVQYLEVGPDMLAADGRPKREIFVGDGLHMNAEGYKIWARLLRPHLN